MSDPKPVDPFAPMGVVSKVNPDGSAEVELNENGRAFYGENMRIVLVPPAAPPSAEDAREAAAKDTYTEGYLDGWADRNGEHGKDPKRAWDESESKRVAPTPP